MYQLVMNPTFNERTLVQLSAEQKMVQYIETAPPTVIIASHMKAALPTEILVKGLAQAEPCLLDQAELAATEKPLA